MIYFVNIYWIIHELMQQIVNAFVKLYFLFIKDY